MLKPKYSISRYFIVLCFQKTLNLKITDSIRMFQHLVIGLLTLLPLSSGLYFHIGETERKCFIEEIPDETMVTGRDSDKPGDVSLTWV